MAIDFTLTAEQRELQLSARAFAQKTFGDIAETIRHLPTARERFAATRPAYEEVVTQAGSARSSRHPPAVKATAWSTWR